MEKFKDVRNLPTGRAALFVPQLGVEMQFMEEPEKVKGLSSNFEHTIDAVLKELNIPDDGRHVDLITIMNNIDRRESRDPWILSIASYLYYLYPDGISEINEVQTGKKIPVLNISDFVKPFISRIEYKKNAGSGVREIDKELLARVTSDVISYYYILSQ